MLTRPAFAALAEQQLSAAGRGAKKALLLLARLDNLRKINSIHGYQMGDHALQETAFLLSRTFRASDLVSRIGGNMFLVLGLEVTEAADDILATRFRGTLAKHEGSRTFEVPLQVSMAGACWDPKAPKPLEQILSEIEKVLA
jgi:diguanylate cyclase (GGDEF)-like protein